MAGFSLLDEQSKYYKHYLILYEKIKEDNSYSLQKYCNENELKVSKFGEWLRRRGIFISEVKQKLYLERIQLQAQDQGQPSGRASFIQFKPNDGPDGDVYIFFSADRQSVKMLKWDIDGFLLYQKRLETGTFEVPIYNEDKGSYELSWEAFNFIMSGVSLRSVHYRRRYRMRQMRASAGI